MAGFLLDTNVLSEFARPLPADARVDAWLKAAPEELLFASVLTFAKVRRGIELLAERKRRTHLEQWQADMEVSFAGRVLPVTMSIGYRWAVLSAPAQRQGTPLAIMDGLIATTAMEHELTVVTRNAKDFAGLDIEVFNPWEAE